MLHFTFKFTINTTIACHAQRCQFGPGPVGRLKPSPKFLRPGLVCHCSGPSLPVYMAGLKNQARGQARLGPNMVNGPGRVGLEAHDAARIDLSIFVCAFFRHLTKLLGNLLGFSPKMSKIKDLAITYNILCYMYHIYV